jgi:hypothetical protein
VKNPRLCASVKVMKNSNAPRTSGAAPAVTLAEFQPRSARLRPRTTRAAVLAILALCHFLLIATRAQNASDTIHADQRDLQQVIDLAPSNAVVQCDPNRSVTLSVPIKIRKPLTLVGLHAQLPEKLGNTSLVIVEAKGVTVTDFELVGNGDSVPQKERAPLMAIYAGDFRVERGRFINSSKDGVMIDGDGPLHEDLVGGVVRDIVGRGVVRDVVSISGSSGHGWKIRNVLVDNVRCYDSRLRGAVEVSDGTDNITVRKVYAESAVYGLDVQDHKEPGQSNRNVVIEDVYAVNCKHAIRTANSRKGHNNLTVRDITARQCTIPIQISHTENVHLSNVRILDHESGKPPIQMLDCRGVSVRDVVVQNALIKGAALQMENCDETLVDGFSLRGQTNSLASAVCFRLTAKATFSGLRISNVSARDVTDAGIVLETKKDGKLTDYLITGNLATVKDGIKGERAIIANNLP